MTQSRIVLARAVVFAVRRATVLAPVLAMVAAVVLGSSIALAGPSVAELSKTLRGAKDFRVRVQAALALGASKDASAVPALCSGLGDRNATVRTAAAAALGRLQVATGVGCLEKQMASEAHGSVKTQITRSLNQIRSVMSRAPDDSTRWYVAVASTMNKSSWKTSEIDVVVQGAIRQVLLAHAGVALAPVGETAEQAQAVLQQRKMQSYMLQPTVEAPEYANSSLVIRVRLTMLTYPGHALQGEFSQKLTQSDTLTEDKQAEEDLVMLVSQKAAESFIKVMETTRQ